MDLFKFYGTLSVTTLWIDLNSMGSYTVDLFKFYRILLHGFI